MKSTRTICISLLALLMAGCAHNRVTLKVDIYGEDPLDTTPLTPMRIEALHEALGQAQMEGSRLTEERTALATRLFDTYAAFHTTISASPPVPNTNAAAELARPRDYLSAYNNVARSKEAEMTDAIHEASRALEAYAKGRANLTNQNAYAQMQGQAAVRRKLDTVSSRLLELADAWATDFEKSFLPALPKLVRAATPEAIKQWTTNGITGGKTLSPAFQGLQTEVEKLQQRRDPRLAAAVGKLKLAAPNAPEELFTRANALVTRPGLGREGKDAVSELNNTQNGEEGMVRDWGDPVWRTLTDPENGWHWHRTFSTNYFYAEGNSSVVIVRDSPVDFRIQKGGNNPSALIQSQLQITRSIADAAISIAGAASGVPIPKPKKPAPPGEPAPAEPESPAPENDFNARKAAVDVHTKFRGDMLRTLRVNLIGLRKEFGSLEPVMHSWRRAKGA